jgi:hypothetical protein
MMLSILSNLTLEKIKAYAVSAVHSARAFLKRSLPIRIETLSLIACYIFAIGMLDWVVERYFLKQAALLFIQWTLAFRPDSGPIYNAPFITYIITLFALIGGIMANQLFHYMPNIKSFAVALADRVWGKVWGCSLILYVVAPFNFSQLCFMLSSIMLGLRLFIEVFPCIESPQVKALSKRRVLFLGLIALLIGSIYIMAKVWYPFTATNDYIEIADSIILPNSPIEPPKSEVVLDRPAILDCLIANKKEYQKLMGEQSSLERAYEVNAPQMLQGFISRLQKYQKNSELIDKISCTHELTQYQIDRIDTPLRQTGGWQSQAGRMLYHHSYLYVPAAHLLKYGLFSNIPYLYGLGNTFFHTLLMMGEPLTLTRYFNTFPIAQLVGILGIVLAVFSMTRSGMVVPFAFAAILIPLSFMGYENLQLAPGFSPLRYFGIALQMASIFWFASKQTFIRVSLLILTLVFSVIWNKEFALLGFFGQMLILMSPQVKLNLVARFITASIAVVLTAGLVIALGTLSHGFLETIQVGIFGVAVPTVSVSLFLKIATYVGALAALLVWAAYRFPAHERLPRLCIIPIMCLLMIKYIYNASPVHLLYTTAFLLPMSLVFLDWKNQLHFLSSWGLNDTQRYNITWFMSSAVVVGCLLCAVHYGSGADQRRAMQTDLFQKNSWSDLGETFITTTPQAPIATRIKAIQAEIKPQDVVIFLSPFDHLMSFYGNPEKYCGHFEYLTNLVTYKNVADVEACARNSPNVLVVYDPLVEKSCPDSVRSLFYDIHSCEKKGMLLQTMINTMSKLKIELVLVKQEGGLYFYRQKKVAEVSNKPAEQKHQK